MPQPRRILPTLIPLASVLALAACQPEADPVPANTGAALDEPALETRGDGSAAGQQEIARASIAPAEDGIAPIACAAERGKAPAQALADQCRRVSPATRPPCNIGNSCAMIDAEIARGCALLDDAAEQAGCTPPRSPEAARDAIRRYYDAINARDYPTAYQGWANEGAASGKDPAAFAQGFARTARTSVDIGTPAPIEAAAGAIYITVPVTVDATLDDGTRQAFRGSYTLRQVNGPNGPGPSQGWHIASARLERRS